MLNAAITHIMCNNSMSYYYSYACFINKKNHRLGGVDCVTLR